MKVGNAKVTLKKGLRLEGEHDRCDSAKNAPEVTSAEDEDGHP